MSEPVLICGGAGFIGTNFASRFCASGSPCWCMTTCPEPGVDRNLQWLKATYGSLLEFESGDIRDARAASAVRSQTRAAVFHFAGQTAVTTSLVTPEGRLRNQRARHDDSARRATRTAVPDSISIHVDEQGIR